MCRATWEQGAYLANLEGSHIEARVLRERGEGVEGHGPGRVHVDDAAVLSCV